MEPQDPPTVPVRPCASCGEYHPVDTLSWCGPCREWFCLECYGAHLSSDEHQYRKAIH